MNLSSFIDAPILYYEDLQKWGLTFLEKSDTYSIIWIHQNTTLCMFRPITGEFATFHPPNILHLKLLTDNFKLVSKLVFKQMKE